MTKNIKCKQAMQLAKGDIYSSQAPLNVKLRVNGIDYSAIAETRTLLSDFLRHSLGLTGTHVGCEHGVCGACTVSIEGVATRSCLVLAVQVNGKSVETVEGLTRESGDDLSLLQQAFKRNHALQCGYCTPGILMSTTRWLSEKRKLGEGATEDEIRDMLSGHLCRCTGYTPIVEAIMEVLADV